MSDQPLKMHTPTTEEVRGSYQFCDSRAMSVGGFDRWNAPREEALAAVQQVRKLHRKETRWGNGDMSVSAKQYDEDGGKDEWPDLEAFDVCAECARIEMSPVQRGEESDLTYLEGLYPCPTIKALDGSHE